MRFYNLDGVEEDVQEPKFFTDEEALKEQLQSLNELLEYYE
jgi:hypothetical protein